MIITPTHAPANIRPYINTCVTPKIIGTPIKNTTPPTRNDLHAISLCEKYIFSSSMFVRWADSSQKNGHV